MRNGSGTYIPPVSTWNPAVDETPIQSGDWNDLLSDMSLALTQSVASDGQTTTSQPIPFAQGVRVSSGSLSSPSISFIGDTDTGVYRTGANAVALVCGGTAVLTADPSGVSFVPPATFVNASFTGNTTIGDASGDTLTVAATGTFNGPQTFVGAVTVPDASFTNAKLANMATQTIKGRTTAGSGAPEDLTATQATAILNPMVGDSGSGGTKGLVPAPAAGDAAARKVLAADGTWQPQRVFAWAKVNGSTGALVSGFNVASASKLSTGNYEITFTTAAGSADYGVTATAQFPSASGFAIATVDNTAPPLVGSVRVRTASLTAAPSISVADVSFLHIEVVL